MELDKPKGDVEQKENDIIYSRAIKAGKRIYYLDVKKSRNDDMFVAITESKKKVAGTEDNLQVTYEKHKIFLYKEDFDKFIDGMEDIIGFIRGEHRGEASRYDEAVEAEEEKEEPLEKPTRMGFFGKFKL